MKRKPLPIGISDFKKVIEGGFAYVDKTLFIMEFKKVGRFEKTDLETAVTSALKQIEDKQYAQELLDRGIKRILYLGLGFEGKKVLIREKFHS